MKGLRVFSARTQKSEGLKASALVLVVGGSGLEAKIVDTSSETGNKITVVKKYR